MPRAGMREIAISYGCFQGLRSRPAGSAVIGNVCMGEASQSDANRRIEFERRHPIFGCVTWIVCTSKFARTICPPRPRSNSSAAAIGG